MAGDIVRGWRYWVIDPAYPGALSSPLRTDGAEDDGVIDRVATSSWIRSECRLFDHVAPDASCACGYRVVEDLYDVLVQIQWSYSDGWSTLHRPVFCPPIAIVAVEGRGRLLPGVEDPRDTWRCEEIRIAGPAYLSPTAAAVMSDSLADLLGDVEHGEPGRSLVEWCLGLNGGRVHRDEAG